MHDKLFANQQNLKRPDLEKYAQELGLDMGKFKAALDSGAGKARIAGRHGAGQAGRRARHAELLHQRPQPRRRAAVRGVQGGHRRRARKRADKLIAEGDAARPGLRRVHEGREGARPAAAAPAAAAAAEGPGRRRRGLQGRRRRRPDQGRQAAQGHHRRVLRLPVPVLQPRERRRSSSSSRTTARTCGSRSGTTRCPFHHNAMPAADGRRGGARAGQVLGDARQAVRQPAARSTARASRSTPRRSASTWASSRPRIDKEKGKERIKRDMDDAAKFGARGTPTFFINGRNFRGAQPVEAFKARHRRGDQEGRREDRRRARRAASSTPR